LDITPEYLLTNTASVKGITSGMVGKLRIINNLVLKRKQITKNIMQQGKFKSHKKPIS
jgi:hypothetical protein